MRVLNIYINDLSPGVAPVDNVIKIEETTVDSEPAIKLTTGGGTTYTTKKSVAQPVIMWE